MITSDTTRSVEFIVKAYAEAYEQAYGISPNIIHKGNQWYAVDEREVIHRSMLLTEIARLRQLIGEQQLREAVRETTAKKNLLSRLISKLRGM